MTGPELRRPVDALVTALRDRPTHLPLGEVVALHRTGHDVSVDLTGPTAVAYVRPRTPERPQQLSDREAEVAVLAARGLSNREIAGALSISLHTVKDHMHAVLTKTGQPSRSRLAAAWHRGELG